MSGKDPRAIGGQIRMRLPLSTPLELRAVDVITSRSDLNVDTSLKENAAESSVSEAMTVKIAKKLGFGGLRALGIAQLNILDALFVAIAQRDFKMAEVNLGKTMNAVSAKRVP